MCGRHAAQDDDPCRPLRSPPVLGGELIAPHARPEVEVEALVPYTHGGLVARAHSEGDVLTEEHTGEGTRLRARVRPDLAGALRRFAPDARQWDGDDDG